MLFRPEGCFLAPNGGTVLEIWEPPAADSDLCFQGPQGGALTANGCKFQEPSLDKARHVPATMRVQFFSTRPGARSSGASDHPSDFLRAL